MKGESPDNNLVVVEEEASGLARWAPLAVVVGVVTGFVVLSWYAYHVGTQSVKDSDLLVVEADKTPMKEKPVDPGGMQFPNQDKTIFETFASGAKQPPKVERVLPAPEEPVSKDMDMSGTDSWINEKLQKRDQEPRTPDKDKAAAEEARKTEATAPVAQTPKATPVSTPSALHQVIAAQPLQDDDQSQTFVAHKTPEKTEAAKTEPALVEKPKENKKEKLQTTATGNAAVQLGAYRTEDELKAAWDKMHIKYKELSDKTPIIIKADLGSKGIYYRLRIGGLTSSADAKALCSSLTAEGQACILPVGK